jgi:hypothetical protein
MKGYKLCCVTVFCICIWWKEKLSLGLIAMPWGCIWGVEVKVHIVRRSWWVVSLTLWPCCSRYPLGMKLDGSQSRSWRGDKDENSCLSRELNSGLSQLFHWLSSVATFYLKYHTDSSSPIFWQPTFVTFVLLLWPFVSYSFFISFYSYFYPFPFSISALCVYVMLDTFHTWPMSIFCNVQNANIS